MLKMPEDGSSRKRHARELLDRAKWLVAVVQDGVVSGDCTAVAVILFDMVNANSGTAWPSLETLGAKARVSRRTAKRAIQILRDAGAIEAERGKGNQTWTYRLVDPGRWKGACTGPLGGLRRTVEGACTGPSRGPHEDHRTQEGNTIRGTQETEHLSAAEATRWLPPWPREAPRMDLIYPNGFPDEVDDDER